MNFNNQYRPAGFGGLPVVTKNILIINVIIFLLTNILKTQGINLVDFFGLHHHLAPAFKPHQFVTYIFMHEDFMHLLFNMLGVYMFGQVLEQLWGQKRYLIFYIVTGLGAAIVQYLILNYNVMSWLDTVNAQINSTYDPIQKASLIDQKYVEINSLDRAYIIGASGSLFGILGAFGMLFPNQMLYIYFLFPVKAKWLVIAYGALELFSGIRNDPRDNIAHFAHLGGLFVGLILVLLWRKNRTHFY